MDSIAAAVGRALVEIETWIFDLDNTLWDGVLLESDDVRLRPETSEVLRALDQRGILLSISSKNAHDHAIGKLRELEIEEYFVYPKISWGPKSENLKQIAKDLNIGIDSIVFLEVANNVKIRVLKDQISGMFKTPEPAPAAAEEKKG